MYTAVPPIDPYTFWTAEALDQQSKERIITGAGLARPGKNYHAVRKVEFNWRTSENPYVIAHIEAQLKSAGWRSKFVIFYTSTRTCTTFF